MVTKLKNKYLPLKTSVRQDAATDLFEPERWIIFLGSDLYSFLFYFRLTFVSFLFVWVRGTMPRFRYDNLIYLAWRRFLPLSLNYLLFFVGVRCFAIFPPYIFLCLLYKQIRTIGQCSISVRSSLLWDVKQRRFEVQLPTFRDNLYFPSSRVKQSTTYRLSRNVENYLPSYVVSHPRRGKIPVTPQRTPKMSLKTPMVV